MFWSSNKIKYELIEKHHLGVKDIATRLGVTPTHVSSVINRRTDSKNVRRAISEILGEPYGEVWGLDGACPCPYCTYHHPEHSALIEAHTRRDQQPEQQHEQHEQAEPEPLARSA